MRESADEEANPAFPTGVGMNRARLGQIHAADRVPHGRGDEPWGRSIGPVVLFAFPTGVGMNRRSPRSRTAGCPRSPRAWG